MPHLVLTLPRRLAEAHPVQPLLETLAQAFATQPTVNGQSVKAYAHLVEHHATGPEAPPDFVHLTIAVLAGRPLQTRQTFAESLRPLLESHFLNPLATHQAKLTIEVREMDPETYIK